MSEVTNDLPAALAEVIDDFDALSEPDRLQLLLELSDELPDLPERAQDGARPEAASPANVAPALRPSGALSGDKP